MAMLFLCPVVFIRTSQSLVIAYLSSGRWRLIARSKIANSVSSTSSADLIRAALDSRLDASKGDDEVSFKVEQRRIRIRMSTSTIERVNVVSTRIGHFRWVICALLLFGVTKNYMDRQVLGVLKTTLQHDLGWNEIDYSNLVFAFQSAYAVGMVVVGRLVDRLGTRLGYALAMVFWSLASMAHAFGRSFLI